MSGAASFKTVNRFRGNIGLRTLLIGIHEGMGIVAGVASLLLLLPRLDEGLYGAYVAVFAITGPLAAFSVTGLILTTFESILHQQRHPNAVMQSCLTILLRVNIVAVPLAVLVCHTSIDILPLVDIVTIVGTELVLTAACFLFVSLIQASGKFEVGLLIKIAVMLTRLAVLIVLAYSGYLTITKLVLGNAIVMAVFAVLAAVLASKTTVGFPMPGPIIEGHLSSVFLYSTGIAASIAQNDGDKVFMQRAGFNAEGDSYATAYRLATIAMLPMTVIGGSTYFATLEHSATERRPVQTVVKYCQAAASFGVPCTLLGWFGAPLLPYFLGDAFRPSVTMIRFLLPALFFRSLTVFVMNGLLGLGANRLRSILLVSASVFAIASYALLVPMYSWKGAIMGSFASELLMLLISSIALHRYAASRFPARHRRTKAG